MRRRRSFEVFTLSFLDTICCGFGAVILLMVLTAVGKPAVLEESRKHLGGRVLFRSEQLNIIPGQTDELNRELVGSREPLERERGKLSNLAGDLSRIRGRYAGSREDAAVTNIIERQLVAGQEALTEQMQRLIARRAQSPRTADIGGIPLDSEYIIFIIDTSSSMTSNHWEVNLGVVRSEEHTSELQSPCNLVCRLLLEKKKKKKDNPKCVDDYYKHHSDFFTLLHNNRLLCPILHQSR